MTLTSNPKGSRPLTTEELEALKRSEMRNEMRYRRLDEAMQEATEESWNLVSTWLTAGAPGGLPTSWGEKLLSKLDENIKTLWEASFPGLIEGMTFSKARLIQGVGTGSIEIFPAAVSIGASGMYVGFYRDLENDQWSARIENADAECNLSLIFLSGTNEINRLELSSSDINPVYIPTTMYRDADRFIFVVM